MRTDTSEYENTHGRKPRGFGLWFFELLGTDGQGRYTTETVRVPNSNYGPAKKAAVVSFKAMVGGVKEVVELKVLP